MKTATLASACVCVLFSAATSAQTTPASRPLIGGHGNNIEAFVAQHDSDGDNRLTWTEFDAFRRERFDATDANGNGTVDEEEYVQEFDDRMRQALERERDGQIEQTRQRFAEMDTDKDGFLSRAEFDASGERVFAQGQKALAEKPKDTAPAGEREQDTTARFDRSGNRLGLPSSHTAEGFLELHDTDGDGNVTRAEFDAKRDAQFARTDGNNGGTLSQDEYLAEYEDRLDRRVETLAGGSDKQTRVRFGALDADKDGRMTFAEYQVSGKRTFDLADRNKDGVIDGEDAKLPPPPRPQRPADTASNAGN